MKFDHYPHLVWANFRVCAVSLSTYRTELIVEVVNLLVKVFAVSALWHFLQRTGLGSADIAHVMPAMPSYAMMGALLSVLLSWWEGPQEEVSERVRNGTIVYDLIRGHGLPLLLLLRELGRTATRFVLIVTPVSVIAMVFMDLKGPANTQRTLFFLLSATLGWLLLFSLNLIVSLLASWTVQLVGIQHAYHGLFMLASGIALPFSFYPENLSTVLKALPFASVFYAPLSIWALPLDTGEVFHTLFKQVIHTLTIAGIAWLLWKRARNSFVILGG